MPYKNDEDKKEYQAKYYQEHKGERKTHTSTKVKSRYNKKTYKNYNINFRVIEDVDIIKLIEDEKKKGVSTTEAFRNLLKKDE